LKLSELAAPVQRLTVDYYGSPVRIGYRPGVMTPLEEEKLAEARKAGETTDALVELMARLMVEWDVTDDDGAPLPITPETLMPFPSALLLRIMSAVQEDMLPNAGRGRR
jgi:hypothetical protein